MTNSCIPELVMSCSPPICVSTELIIVNTSYSVTWSWYFVPITIIDNPTSLYCSSIITDTSHYISATKFIPDATMIILSIVISISITIMLLCVLLTALVKTVANCSITIIGWVTVKIVDRLSITSIVRACYSTTNTTSTLTTNQ